MAKLPRQQVTSNRLKAIDNGDKHYLGNPCIRGHSGWRRLKPNGAGDCVECLSINHKKWRDKNSEHCVERKRQWYEKNQAHCLDYAKDMLKKTRN